MFYCKLALKFAVVVVWAKPFCTTTMINDRDLLGHSLLCGDHVLLVTCFSLFSLWCTIQIFTDKHMKSAESPRKKRSCSRSYVACSEGRPNCYQGIPIHEKYNQSTFHRTLYFTLWFFFSVTEGYLPPQLFYSGMLNYIDTQRAGGLASHLLHEHRGNLQ